MLPASKIRPQERSLCLAIPDLPTTRVGQAVSLAALTLPTATELFSATPRGRQIRQPVLKRSCRTPRAHLTLPPDLGHSLPTLKGASILPSATLRWVATLPATATLRWVLSLGPASL